MMQRVWVLVWIVTFFGVRMFWTHFELEHFRDAYYKVRYGDMPYKQQIEVDTFCLSSDELVKFLKDPSKLPQQDAPPFPRDQKRYRLFCLKNHGDKTAWGYLEDAGITLGQLPPRMKSYMFGVLPYEPSMVVDQHGKPPKPEWTYLYTMP